MKTDCGARDGHCQHDTDHGIAFAEMPGQTNPQSQREAWRAPGSWLPWEMGSRHSEDEGEEQTLPPPVLLLVQVPWSEKWGEPPQTRMSVNPGGCCLPEEGEDEHRQMGMEAEALTGGTDGWMDGWVHMPVQ